MDVFIDASICTSVYAQVKYYFCMLPAPSPFCHRFLVYC